jgi:peptide/nickel transport system substrate-binding protein
MELEYAFGMPVQPSGALYSQAGLFDWMTSNSNASIWYFNIRPDAKWSDGTPITSADVNFTFGLGSGYIMGTPADFLGLGTNLVQVNVLNSSETEFVLSASEPDFGPLLAAQSYYAVVPEHVWAGTNFTNSPNFGQDVTSGPFYHLAYNGGNDIILKANPYYWNPPGVSEIDITFVAQSSQAPTQLAGSQTDLAQVTPDFVSGFVNNSQYGLNVEPDRGIAYLEYNVSESPFSNTAFRQAMALTINTSAIVQTVYKGYATPGSLGRGTIPPSSTEWHNPNTVQYQYDLSAAKNLLSNEGYTWDNSGNLHYPNGTAVSFTIYTDNDVITDYETSQQVSADLNALGMQTHVTAESLATIAGDYTSGTGDIASQLVVASNTSPIFGLGFLDIEPGYDIYYPWFVSQPAWTTPASAQSEFDNLTNIVDSSTNQAQVQQAVQSIDLLNSQTLPNIVLAYPDTIWVYRTGLFTGMPTSSSSAGFDMGAISLNPYTFSQIQAIGTSQTSTGSSQNNTLLIIVAAVIVVIVVVGVALVMMRRRGPRAQAEPSPIS